MKNKKYHEMLNIIKKNKGTQIVIEDELEEDDVRNVESEEKSAEKENDDKIRITMLGFTSSGKTAFLSGVYQTMISDPLTDIYLLMNDSQENNELCTSIEQIAMVRGDIVTEFPPGTYDTKSYELILAGGGREYCKFEFWDYRGSLVSQVVPGREEGTDVEEFKTQLVKSDVILVFADAVLISQYQDVRERRIKCKANEINHIFTQVLRESEQQHVILVLTKTDDSYVKVEDKADCFKNLCKKAMEIYEPICNRSKSFAMIPVSAVGADNTITHEQRDITTGETHWVSTLKKNAIPQPENVDLVILYACRLILERRLRQWKTELEELNLECAELEKKLASKNKIKKILMGDSHKEKLQELFAEICEKGTLVSDLERNIQHMSEIYADKFRLYLYYEKGVNE